MRRKRKIEFVFFSSFILASDESFPPFICPLMSKTTEIITKRRRKTRIKQQDGKKKNNRRNRDDELNVLCHIDFFKS